MAPTNVPDTETSPGDVAVAPRGLSATLTTGRGVVLNWNPVAGAAYYNVYPSQLTGGGSGAAYVALGSSGVPNFADATATPGRTFFYVVTTSSGGTETASSSEAAAQVPLT